MRLKEALQGKLSAKELEKVTGSFDIIGGIAKIDVDPSLKKKEKIIAAAVLAQNPSITTVVKKAGIHSGKYRAQKVTILAGEKTKEAVHKESGIAVALNVEKCYFSVRLSSERLRIASLVKKGERVLVLFSGVGIYPIIISKKSSVKEVVGVEWNLLAHRYAEENIRKNRCGNVRLLKGDVRKVKIPGKFDHVVMPLPKEAEKFLPTALKYVKKGGMIHLYTFLHEDEMKEKPKELLSPYFKKRGFRIVRTVKCGAYASRVYRVCLDVKVV